MYSAPQTLLYFSLTCTRCGSDDTNLNTVADTQDWLPFEPTTVLTVTLECKNCGCNEEAFRDTL